MTFSHKQAESMVDAVVKYTMDHSLHERATDPSRIEFLRVSSLPFCSRQMFLGVFGSLNTTAHLDSRMMFYVTIGSGVHEVTQHSLDFMSHPGKTSFHELGRLPGKCLIVQDWRCLECRHDYVFQPRPLRCDWCGHTEFSGHEHTVRYGKRILGHMDGTYAFPSPDDPKATYSKQWVHVPIDYKTSTLSAVASGNGLPHPGNVSQLEAYGAIKANEGYNIRSAALIYISRDSPFKRRVCAFKVNTPLVLKKLAVYEAQYEATWAVINKPTVKAAMALPPVVDKDFEYNCGFCKFTDACLKASKGNTGPLEAQVKTRVEWLSSTNFNARRGFPRV